MFSYNKKIGSFGESIAENYLIKNGYTILDKNFRCQIGEIDIIGKDNCYISFIEVKTRYGNMYGSPRESVNYKKQVKIYKTAQIYIMRKKLFKSNFRFDVVEVYLNTTDNNFSISLIKNAFQI